MDLVVSGILNFLTEQEAIGKADEVQGYYRRVSCRYIFQMQSADVFDIYCYSFS